MEPKVLDVLAYFPSSEEITLDVCYFLNTALCQQPCLQPLSEGRFPNINSLRKHITDFLCFGTSVSTLALGSGTTVISHVTKKKYKHVHKKLWYPTDQRTHTSLQN